MDIKPDRLSQSPVDIVRGGDSLVDPQHLGSLQLDVRIDYVRIKDFKPRPICVANFSVRTGNDKAEAPAPTRVAIREYSIERKR
jgi:hypothetical protein